MEMINSVSSNHKLAFLVLLNISFVLVILSVITLVSISSESVFLHTSVFVSLEASGSSQQVISCKGLHNLDGYEAKCLYVKTHNPCVSQGYVDYLHLFYCMFGNLPFLCYALMFAWLVILFYLMGDTASRYFCSSLEKLSNLLNLSPAIAGVTLLSLGNGAPDVFASLVSYMGSGTKDVGMNSVMGGASFVTCVVIGVISIVMHSKRIEVNKNDFFRDVCFLIFVLVCLLVILLIGEIYIWVAINFASLYIVYVVLVYFSHLNWNRHAEDDSLISNGSEMDVPFLQNMEVINKEQVLMEEGDHESQFQIVTNSSFSDPWKLFLWILQMPLHLPRRLTIPVVSPERWSKPYAVMSVTLAPILLAILCSSHLKKMNSKPVYIIYGICFILGSTFGVLALITTERSNPPNKCLFPWVVGSFLMSVTWSYIIADELVGLLVSLGYVCGISPSILGLTILAWGNSLGDLVTNSTLAVHGGRVGAQIAVSGCYAGPIFNILMGLGLSLVGSAWYAYPSPIAISTDPLIFETLVFLVVGLLWALVMLPRREMKLDRILGGGLLVLYVASVALRLIQTL